MGAEVANDRDGGGGARFDVNLSGGGRFIDIGLFILPKLDIVTKGETAESGTIRMQGASTKSL